MSAVTDALKTIKLAEEMNKPVVGAIVTRFRGKSVDMSISNIKDMLEIPILGVIPEEDSVRESHNLKNPVFITHPKSRAARTYHITSRRLLGHDVPLELPAEGFFSRIFFFRR